MKPFLCAVAVLLVALPGRGAEPALQKTAESELAEPQHGPSNRPIKFELWEKLSVPSDGSVIETRRPTDPDALYLIVVSGTYKWGDCDPTNCPGAGACGFDRFGDAEYLTDDCWETHFDEYLGFDVSLFMNGGNVDWGPFNEAHVYFAVRPGTGSRFSFFIHDCPGCYVDNEGSLKVKIYVARKLPFPVGGQSDQPGAPQLE